MRVKNLISRMAQERIVLLATHVVSDIEQIGRELILMKDGRVLETGTPRELLASVKDKVYDLTVTGSELEEVRKQYRGQQRQLTMQTAFWFISCQREEPRKVSVADGKAPPWRTSIWIDLRMG